MLLHKPGSRTGRTALFHCCEAVINNNIVKQNSLIAAANILWLQQVTAVTMHVCIGSTVLFGTPGMTETQCRCTDA